MTNENIKKEVAKEIFNDIGWEGMSYYLELENGEITSYQAYPSNIVVTDENTIRIGLDEYLWDDVLVDWGIEEDCEDEELINDFVEEVIMKEIDYEIQNL